jgi:hypothetical protein
MVNKGLEGMDVKEGVSSVLDSTVNKIAAFMLLIAIVCCGTVAYTYRSHFSGDLVSTHEAWGQFGDFFGGTLNPILAMLSLFAILGALIIQSRELSHSTSALREQSEHLSLQAFENTFFAMIQINSDNVRGLDLEDTEKSDGYNPGRGAFRFLVLRLKAAYDFSSKYSGEGKDEREVIGLAYKNFYSLNDRFIGHYLSGLERVIEFIEIRRPVDRRQYYLIVGAQLSQNELILLFYHSLSCSGVLGIENLNKFLFFEKLPVKSVFNEQLHLPLIINSGDK